MWPKKVKSKTTGKTHTFSRADFPKLFLQKQQAQAVKRKAVKAKLI